MPVYVLNALFWLAGLLLICQLYPLLPRVRFLPRLLIHAVTGLAGLLMANVLGAQFGLGLGLNAITLPVGAGLGVPGVALLWALRYLL